jgi:hypothetical protein
MDQNENDASRASVESFVPRPQYRLDCPKYHNLVMEAIEEQKAERKERTMKRTTNELALAILNARWEEDEMNSEEKLKRVLQDEWEIHGDAKQLCLLLREEVFRLREAIKLAECQYLGCGGRLEAKETVLVMREILQKAIS